MWKGASQRMCSGVQNCDGRHREEGDEGKQGGGEGCTMTRPNNPESLCYQYAVCVRQVYLLEYIYKYDGHSFSQISLKLLLSAGMYTIVPVHSNPFGKTQNATQV